MILLGQEAEYLKQEPGVEGVYKIIEKAARTCYKSEAKCDGTLDGAKAFVERMIKSHHTAMLESCSVYLKCYRNFEYENNIEITEYPSDLEFYATNKYSKINFDKDCHYVTTNLRVLVENNRLDDLKYWSEPTDMHEKRYTFRLVTDRAIANEIVRHRAFSFAQESTRFVDYTNEKHGTDIAYIMPDWFSGATMQQQEAFMQLMKDTEDVYFALRGKWDERKPDKRFKTGFKDNPLTPQQARAVFPLCLKTELCITGYVTDWKFFLDLRLFGKTGKPHPQIVELSEKIVEEMKKAGIYESVINTKSKFDQFKYKSCIFAKEV